MIFQNIQTNILYLKKQVDLYTGKTAIKSQIQSFCHLNISVGYSLEQWCKFYEHISKLVEADIIVQVISLRSSDTWIKTLNTEISSDFSKKKKVNLCYLHERKKNSSYLDFFYSRLCWIGSGNQELKPGFPCGQQRLNPFDQFLVPPRVHISRRLKSSRVGPRNLILWYGLQPCQPLA